MPPDPTPVLDLMSAFRASDAMFAAVSLGVFDRLAEGPADLASLARHLAADADALERLLDAAALPPGGALLVAEKLLDDDRSGPRWAQMQSLNMLVCTEGKERTLGEYEALLREAGFACVEGRRTGSPLDAVLATKDAAR